MDWPIFLRFPIQPGSPLADRCFYVYWCSYALIYTEPECRVLTELTGLVHFDIAISFHSGKEQIIIPHRGKMCVKPIIMMIYSYISIYFANWRLACEMG